MIAAKRKKGLKLFKNQPVLIKQRRDPQVGGRIA